MRDNYEVILKGTCKCNLDCVYCYDKPNRERLGTEVLSLERVNKLYRLLGNYAKRIHILYHGGEPTTLPIDWYRQAYDLALQNYNTNYVFNMQSNGVNLVHNTQSWTEFFCETDNILGISFDGTSQYLRMPTNTEEKVTEYVETMQTLIKDLPHNKLCIIDVITKENVDNQIETYEFLKRNLPDGMFTLTNPLCTEVPECNHGMCVDLDTAYDSMVEFRKHVMFDTSHNALSETILTTYTDRLLSLELAKSCYFCECGSHNMGIHPDGELLFCDIIFRDHRMPNIDDIVSIEDFHASEPYRRLVSDINSRKTSFCQSCTYCELCNGFCPQEHYNFTGRTDICSDYICKLVKVQLNSAYEVLQSITQETLINREYLDKYVQHKHLLPMEIEYFLSKVGIPFKMYVNLNSTSDLPSLIPYKVFTYFRSSDECIPAPLFSEERFVYFKEIYEKYKPEINDLIGGYN